VLIVNFKGGTPFMEGPGPFGKDDVHTVLNKPPLKQNQRFQPDFILDGKVLKTEGDIIINGG
jgi:hypothetical protein